MVIGTGIRAGTQLTPEARAAFEHAEVALYLVADPVEASLLEELNPSARSLYDHYRHGVPRREIYDAIAETILVEVRHGQRVCVAFYGHPGVFVDPSHAAIACARSEGFPARMLPAVSAEDCLFADLGVDPGATGCQSYEATDFLLQRRPVDPTAALILWQVGALGETIYSTAAGPQQKRVEVLTEYLRHFYDGNHVVILYEASPYPIIDSMVRSVGLSELSAVELTPLSTLYVPPLSPHPADPEMAARLGLPVA